MDIFITFLKTFIVGGLICVAGQLLIDLTRLTPARILVGFVVLGVFLSAVGIYEPFAEYAGAGASVPLLGFGNVLMKGVKEAVDQEGIMGLFSGGFKAGAVGTSAALIFGLLAAFVFNPKMKK